MNPSANKSILFLAIDLRPSTGLTLNLSSNNPFRNRAASPSLSDGQRSPFDPPPRPVSRNPFLDAPSAFPQPPVVSPDKMSFAAESSAPRPALTGNAAELFVRHFILSTETLFPSGFHQNHGKVHVFLKHPLFPRRRHVEATIFAKCGTTGQSHSQR